MYNKISFITITSLIALSISNASFAAINSEESNLIEDSDCQSDVILNNQQIPNGKVTLCPNGTATVYVIVNSKQPVAKVCYNITTSSKLDVSVDPNSVGAIFNQIGGTTTKSYFTWETGQNPNPCMPYGFAYNLTDPSNANGGFFTMTNTSKNPIEIKPWHS